MSTFSKGFHCRMNQVWHQKPQTFSTYQVQSITIHFEREITAFENAMVFRFARWTWNLDQFEIYGRWEGSSFHEGLGTEKLIIRPKHDKPGMIAYEMGALYPNSRAIERPTQGFFFYKG